MSEHEIRKGASAWITIGIIAAALPMVVTVSSSSMTTVNGHTTVVYRDWIAVAGGVVAALCGVIALVTTLRGNRRGAFLGLGAVLIAAGGLQVARGFGAFVEAPSGATGFSTEITTPPIPTTIPESTDPATCPDKEACDRLASRLKTTDPKGAVTANMRSCEFGQPYACEEAGGAWARGEGVAEDPEQALPLYEKGCTLGNTDACGEAGALYYTGRGAAKDVERARGLMTKACEGGTLLSCKNLVIVYRDAAPADPAKAFEYAKRACGDGRFESSDAPEVAWGCEQAAVALLEGKDGAKADGKAALELFEVACNRSHTSCYNLGVVLDDGLGKTKKDPVRARAVYTAACEAGSAGACNNLGDMLNKGRGGAKDRAKAKELFERACKADYELGCKNSKTL